MKKLLYLLTVSVILFSCGGDDDPVVTHEMGSWSLDSYILTNVPADYSNNDGRIFLINQVSFGGIVFESYEITLNSDLTFDRSIGLPGPDARDNGTWELDGDDLIITSDEADGASEEYRIERNENDQLWWSVGSQFVLLKNSIADTITQEYLDSLTDEEFAALFDAVSVDLVYAFERQ